MEDSTKALYDIVYHAAIGEDYDIALFIHNMRDKMDMANAPVDYKTLSNFLSNECYREVQRVALVYATKATISATRQHIVQQQRYQDTDATLCEFARRLRNNACKAVYIKEYMECFA